MPSTLFTAARPRDRSHFEKFRSYHEKLYSYVEPTSVTPFARPVLERGAHAVLAGFVRLRDEETVHLRVSEFQKFHSIPFDGCRWCRFYSIRRGNARSGVGGAGGYIGGDSGGTGILGGNAGGPLFGIDLGIATDEKGAELPSWIPRKYIPIPTHTTRFVWILEV